MVALTKLGFLIQNQVELELDIVEEVFLKEVASDQESTDVHALEIQVIQVKLAWLDRQIAETLNNIPNDMQRIGGFSADIAEQAMVRVRETLEEIEEEAEEGDKDSS